MWRIKASEIWGLFVRVTREYYLDENEDIDIYTDIHIFSFLQKNTIPYFISKDYM